MISERMIQQLSLKKSRSTEDDDSSLSQSSSSRASSSVASSRPRSKTASALSSKASALSSNLSEDDSSSVSERVMKYRARSDSNLLKSSSRDPSRHQQSSSPNIGSKVTNSEKIPHKAKGKKIDIDSEVSAASESSADSMVSKENAGKLGEKIQHDSLSSNNSLASSNSSESSDAEESEAISGAQYSVASSAPRKSKADKGTSRKPHMSRSTTSDSESENEEDSEVLSNAEDSVVPSSSLQSEEVKHSNKSSQASSEMSETDSEDSKHSIASESSASRSSGTLNSAEESAVSSLESSEASKSEDLNHSESSLDTFAFKKSKKSLPKKKAENPTLKKKHASLEKKIEAWRNEVAGTDEAVASEGDEVPIGNNMSNLAPATMGNNYTQANIPAVTAQPQNRNPTRRNPVAHGVPIFPAQIMQNYSYMQNPMQFMMMQQQMQVNNSNNSDPSGESDDLTPFDSVSNGPMRNKKSFRTNQMSPAVVQQNSGAYQVENARGFNNSSAQPGVPHMYGPAHAYQQMPMMPMQMMPMNPYMHQQFPFNNNTAQNYPRNRASSKGKTEVPQWMIDEQVNIGGNGTLMEKVKKGRDTPQATHNLVSHIKYDKRGMHVPTLQENVPLKHAVPQQFHQMPMNQAYMPAGMPMPNGAPMYSAFPGNNPMMQMGQQYGLNEEDDDKPLMQR